MPHAADLYYEVHGPDDAAPLILSPGLGGSGSYWQPNLDMLARYFRVILYDHRGTARSCPEGEPNPTISEMALDVVALMDALDIPRAHLMGHALGGIIGLSLAMQAPERLDRLVVVNGWAKLDPYTARCFDTRLKLLRDSGPEAYVRAQPIFLYPPDWISVNDARLEAEASAHLAHFPPPETVEARVAALRAWDPGAALRAVSHPVLVLATADDALVPAHAARGLCDLLPNHTRMLQFYGGHASNITEPDEFYERVLPWLLRSGPDEED
ncbi:pyrimidine utilization protein D [Stakelama tenebrarum]|uniref:Putative carbamate hydrolase RutD n=1 Tax=Stakelama tenebrarum TaxID=2711215 RepID=A0A6G6Y4P1_9SPHN|nr:pyrimidine utilization protein D [Sphingosinithalassobacter tenebrarum]QIG79870.1 pyrimidine utilization protein D [Sphingosinithalassobacter tenebrarum]